MDYDSTNNVFSDISDCELVEANQLVEELECSYLSDVELVSASQNVEDTLKIGDSKNVIVFDPLHMGHVIRRMRSGRVRIFNGNQ